VVDSSTRHLHGDAQVSLNTAVLRPSVCVRSKSPSPLCYQNIMAPTFENCCGRYFPYSPPLPSSPIPFSGSPPYLLSPTFPILLGPHPLNPPVGSAGALKSLAAGPKGAQPTNNNFLVHFELKIAPLMIVVLKRLTVTAA